MSSDHLIRIYIDRTLHRAVLNFAKLRFELHGERAPNGRPLHHCFPVAMQRYIDEVSR